MSASDYRYADGPFAGQAPPFMTPEATRLHQFIDRDNWSKGVVMYVIDHETQTLRLDGYRAAQAT